MELLYISASIATILLAGFQVNKWFNKWNHESSLKSVKKWYEELFEGAETSVDRIVIFRLYMQLRMIQWLVVAILIAVLVFEFDDKFIALIKWVFSDSPGE